MTPAEFLTARLDEDEAAALAAKGDRRRWVAKWGMMLADPVPGGVLDPEPALLKIGAHVFRHEPARVLREVAAGRAILAEHAPGYPTIYPEPSGQPTCGVCHADGWDWEPQKWPCATVRALVATRSDHPDYRQEWETPPP